jgi:hypothetical protein
LYAHRGRAGEIAVFFVPAENPVAVPLPRSISTRGSLFSVSFHSSASLNIQPEDFQFAIY